MDEDEAETVRKEKTKTPSGWKCVLCHERYKDRDVYVSHMAEKHGKVSESTTNFIRIICLNF